MTQQPTLIHKSARSSKAAITIGVALLFAALRFADSGYAQQTDTQPTSTPPVEQPTIAQPSTDVQTPGVTTTRTLSIISTESFERDYW